MWTHLNLRQFVTNENNPLIGLKEKELGLVENQTCHKLKQSYIEKLTENRGNERKRTWSQGKPTLPQIKTILHKIIEKN